MNRYVGIDPGNEGAVALIEEQEVLFWDTPVTKTETQTKTHTMIDAHAAAALIRELAIPETYFIVEHVNAMPGLIKSGARVSIGATSAFNFGTGYGMWIGILASFRCHYTLVRPQVWKKVMVPGVTGPDKDGGRIRARQLFPQAAEQLNRKKDHGRADALLIAAYGRKILNQ